MDGVPEDALVVVDGTDTLEGLIDDVNDYNRLKLIGIY